MRDLFAIINPSGIIPARAVTPALPFSALLPSQFAQQSFAFRQESVTYSDRNFENLQSYLSAIKDEKKDTGASAKARSTTTRRPRRTRPTRPRRTTRRLRSTTTLDTPTTTAYTSPLKPVDVAWILLSGVLIFTMQTGFGLLEAGIVSPKNETNIMLKNIADIVLGGFTYWIFGYGITYGRWRGSSSVFGFGLYAVDADIPGMGDLFTSFFFQLSFATTATTIVSGAVAERCNYKAYCLYSIVATVTYCVAARWVWGPDGWLAMLGAVDVAGSGVVHLTGGAAALVAAWFIGPRLGRFEYGAQAPPWGNPTSAFVGTLILWWAWIAFNAGSTYGLTSDLWKFAARACATTMVGSIGGGLVGMLWAFVKPGKFFDPDIPINSVLGSLVGITAGCAVMHTPEAFGTGAIGAVLVLIAGKLTELAKIDDVVGAWAVHGVGGIWGLLAVGIFAEDDEGILGLTKGRAGLARRGWYLLGVQALTAVTLTAWSMISTFFIFFFINLIIPFRVKPEEELLGLDLTEHGIRRKGIGISPTISLFQANTDIREMQRNIPADTGQNNLGHDQLVALLREDRKQRSYQRSGRNRLKFRAAGQFARAFNKLRAKGRRVSPRSRQYLLKEYTSSLKSSTGSITSGQKRIPAAAVKSSRSVSLKNNSKTATEGVNANNNSNKVSNKNGEGAVKAIMPTNSKPTTTSVSPENDDDNVPDRQNSLRNANLQSFRYVP